jgi:hypothetical protein
MWFYITSKPTINPEEDWTHEIILSKQKRIPADQWDYQYPIPIITTASETKPVYVVYHLIDNGICEIGPLLFTNYKDAYDLFKRYVHKQYDVCEEGTNVIVFQRLYHRMISTMYQLKPKGLMKFVSRWNLDTITMIE